MSDSPRPVHTLEDAQEAALLEHVRSLESQQLGWTRQLIAIPTVNPYSGDDSAASEAPGQDWVSDQLKAMGAEVSRLAVPEDVYEQGQMIGPVGRQWQGRENVLGQWTLGDGSGPTIIVNDHMDTVGTHGMTIAPFDPIIKDGRIYGRGTSDTKGNLVMGLIAIKALLANPCGVNGRIIFQSVVDEECNGAGAGTLACCLAGVTGDAAIVLDGGGGASGLMINGCNGVATAAVHIQGKAGHNAGGKGSSAVNAIDKAFLAKQVIDRFAADHLTAYPTCSTNLGVFRSGTLPSIVPSEAELQINFAYPPEEGQISQDTLGRWGGGVFRQRFETTLTQSLATDLWLRDHPPVVTWIKDMYPFACDAQSPVFEVAAAAMKDQTGQAVNIAPMAAWFDGAHLATQLNIPVIGLGHGQQGCAHGPEEYAVVNDLHQGARTVALTLKRLLEQLSPT